MRILRRKAGFTLIETIIALFIISIAVTAALVSSRTGVRSSEYSRDEIVAFYLTNEVIEYFRNLRDTNLSKGRDWLHGIPSECFEPTDLCRLNIVEKKIELVTDVEDLRLKFNPSQSSGYIYNDDNVEIPPSRFSRIISMKKDEDEEQLILTVRIEWQSGPFKDAKFSVRTLLTNINSI